jgi:ribosomal protein L31
LAQLFNQGLFSNQNTSIKKESFMKTTIHSASTKILITCFLLSSVSVLSQLKQYDVESFEKVIVSPHIAVTFAQGTSESVVIQSSTEPLEKLNVEVSGRTLRLYLDDAKTVTKQEKVKNEEWSGKQSIYKGTVVQATVTYKELEELSLRGEEKFECKSALTAPRFTLTLYGESDVLFEEVHLDNFNTTIYGESFLEIRSGHIGRQKITAYGETRVNTLGSTTDETKITAYGEGEYSVAVSNRLKITAYGEATVAYMGDPQIDKGVILGEARIQKID